MTSPSDVPSVSVRPAGRAEWYVGSEDFGHSFELSVRFVDGSGSERRAVYAVGLRLAEYHGPDSVRADGAIAPMVCGLKRQDLVDLMDALWREGIRPSHHTERGLAHVNALEAHIDTLKADIDALKAQVTNLHGLLGQQRCLIDTLVQAFRRGKDAEEPIDGEPCGAVKPAQLRS